MAATTFQISWYEKSLDNFFLHFVRLFWNQTLTWFSVMFNDLAKLFLSGPARYFLLSKVFSKK